MNWSDVTKPPSTKTLRQFAILFLLFFGGIAAWRAWQGQATVRTEVLAGAAVLVGVLGSISPAAIRWIYTGWMIVAFPIGWTVSRLVVAVLFFGVFTPVGLVFRLFGRDALSLRRRSGAATYWAPKTGAVRASEYFRQF